MMIEPFEIATIGFTKTSAFGFFDRIKRSGVRKVIDVRLHNTSQLAGFTKADDIAYFLQEICGVEYEHAPVLAPTDDILKAFKRDKVEWSIYQELFLNLMAEREIENRLKPEMLHSACLLCSEPTQHYCHRRLVCEYLNGKWGGALKVRHL